MHPSATGVVEQSDGLLAHGGTAMVKLYVFHRPSPQEPPSQWAELLEPERRKNGMIVDWHPRSSLDAGQRDQLRQWRSGYVTERLIGDVATVRGFLDWADRHCEVSALHPLRLSEAHFPVHSVMRIAQQAQDAAEVCRRRGDVGLGLMAADHDGLVRGFANCDGPVTVLADRGTRIVAAGDAVQLSDPVVGTATVTGWHRADGGLTASTPAGELPLGVGRAAALLSRLAPGSDAVRVQQVALPRIFAELLVHLPDMAREAAHIQTELLAHTSFQPWR